MAGRSSRSPAGLHPNNSPASPRIEDLLNISMHPVPSPRAQRVSGTPNQPSTRRSLYSSLSPAGHSSISQVHPDAALGSGVSSSRISSMMSTSPTNRRSASSSFVPRIVRGTISGRDTAASSSTSSSHGAGVNSAGGPVSSPTRTRRPSNSATATLSTQHRTISAPSPSTIVPPPSQTTSFPRPSYLEYSAMRYCIQSEPNPNTPPDMYRFGTLHTGTTPARSRSRDMSSSSRDTDSDEESNTSTGDRGHTVSPSRITQRKPVPTFIHHLPTAWSNGDRYPSLSVSVDGRDLTFHGPANGGDKDAAAARANFPIPAACGIYYYEIEILSKGMKGHIAIGFGTDAVKLSRLPGWEEHSWGYHGDDGNSFASDRTGKGYGPKFTTQDFVGCGLDFSTGQAFFTKNGRYLGPAFDNLTFDGDLYPTVGLRTPGESIRVNFGHEPFKFDIDSHVEHKRNTTWGNIQNTPVTWSLSNDIGTFNIPISETSALNESAEVSRPLNDLILGYLTHHGYAKTARAFKTQRDRRNGVLTEQSDLPSVDGYSMRTETDNGTSTSALDASIVSTGSNSSMDSAIIQGDTLKRQKIVRSIVLGDIDTALEETRTHFPTVLDRNGGMILFKLRCRKFVELVLDAAAAWRKVREAEARGKGKDSFSNGIFIPDGSESMDIDEDGGFNGSMTNGAASPAKLRVKTSFSSASTSKPLSQIALEHALTNGQSLQADYKSDARPEVQAIYRKALSLVAYDDPLADDPRVPEPVKEMAGQGARDTLAEEVNRAILESQGRPPHAALERLYRQTQACVMQLGWMGVGSAAFADMPKEFLDA